MIRMNRILLSIATMAICIARLMADQPAATQLLEKAFYQEQTVGDLNTALEIYQQIVKQHQQNEPIIAQARLRIGLIHLKRGEHEQATAVLQSLADKYPGLRHIQPPSGRTQRPDIDEAIRQIRANYIDEITDDGELTDAALRGVLQNLDSYSAYIDAETLKEFRVNLSGKLVGIGAVIGLEDGRLVVTNPLPGSPAAESGLVAGDTIVTIDGVPVDSFAEQDRIKESINHLRGKSGEQVSVEVVSKDSNQPRLVEITRREIKLQRLIGIQRDENDRWLHRLHDAPEIGYIRIIQLTEGTAGDFRRVAESLEADGIKGLIIDLRDNGGGLLSAALEIADMFLSDGVMLKVRGRNVSPSQYAADSEEILNDVPVAILVNRQTASAAEILTGTLQDRGRATVVGERTFGKGTVQTLFPLQSGGAIKLTTARYYLPSGVSLERPANPDQDDQWGVDPTAGFAVELSPQERQALKALRTAIDRFGKSDSANPEVDDKALRKAVDHVKAL